MPIEKDARFPIDRPEVQKDMFAGPGLRDGKLAPVPQGALGVQRDHDAGKRGFDWKRNQNLPGEFAGRAVVKWA